jgi:hypothetical protein
MHSKKQLNFWGKNGCFEFKKNVFAKIKWLFKIDTFFRLYFNKQVIT